MESKFLSNLFPNSKKGQVVSNVVAGIGALIILVIIVFVIVSTLNSADLLGVQETATIQVDNETVAWLNVSNYTLAVNNDSLKDHTIIRAWNLTGAQIVPSGYHQLDGLIVFTNGTDYPQNATTASNQINITYTYVYVFGAKSSTQNATDNLILNFTEGIDEVSKKIPTILLIVAVVFLFGALVLLVQQSRRMGIGSGSSL